MYVCINWRYVYVTQLFCK